MGYDQRDVPLTVHSHGSTSSLLPYVLLVIFGWAPLIAGDGSLPVRCGFATPEAEARLASLNNGILAAQRPVLPESVSSPGGRFRIHFTRTGPDAVPPDDADGNGIPDYVDEAGHALDKAFLAEVDTMGYVSPPSDDTAGGSPQFDLYLHDLSKAGQGFGLYGITEPERALNGSGLTRYTSWMEADNDFSPNDRNAFDSVIYATTGIAALRVTCAHEFHHMIQLGGYGDTGIQRSIHELSSTWMEMRVWPEIRDWTAYTGALLRNPERYPLSLPETANGYYWGWFGKAMHRLDGDAPLRRTWELIATGMRPFAALDQACGESGSRLEPLFCNTIAELYRTGSRGQSNTLLPKAELLPEIHLASDDRVRPPSALITGELRPYEVRCHRFSVPSLTDADRPVSVAIVLSAPDTDAMIASSTAARTAYAITLTSNRTEEDLPINGSAWGLRITATGICYKMDGATTERVEGPYPMPFVRSMHDRLNIPVPFAMPGDHATITVLMPTMRIIASDEATVILDDTRIVVPWANASTLHSGIYLLRVNCSDRTELYKLVVRE